MAKNHEIDVLINTKDRHSEVCLAIQSLRTQDFKKWNLLVLDDASGTPLQACYFFNYLVNRLKLEGHKVKVIRNDRSYGVCHARNLLIEEQLNWNSSSDLVFRCDDDVILESDYLSRLIKVIDSGYDIASGIVPLLVYPGVEREVKFVGKIINEHKLDKEGNLVQNNDDCGYSYIEEKVIPTHQFRTNALYKTKVHEKVKYEKHLTTVGFREEGFFSFRAILNGFTIGVDVQAKSYHLQCPSGGVRRQDYGQCIQLDDETFKKWFKEMFEKHGNFLDKYNKKVLKNDN